MAHLDNSEAAGGYSLEVPWEEIRETAGYTGHDFSVGPTAENRHPSSARVIQTLFVEM